MSKIELEKIADIIPPTAPENATEIIWIILTGFALVIIIGVIKHYLSCHQKLNRLQKKYNNNEINQRQLAFSLSKILKNNIQHTHSNKTLNEQLQAACFSRNGLDKNTMDSLIKQVKKWI